MNMTGTMRALGAAAIAMGGLAGAPASAVMLSLSPATQTATVGDTLTVDVLVSGLGAGVAPSLGAFDLDVSFDEALLAFDTAIFGTQLDVLGLGSLQLTTPGMGTVNLFELSLDTATDLADLQADSFVLASLSFSALAAGTGSFGLSILSLADENGDALAADASGARFRVDARNSVPEPGVLGLLGLGGLLLVGMRHLRA